MELIILVEPSDVNNFIGELNPFNTEKCMKNLSSKILKMIGDEIADEIKNGYKITSIHSVPPEKPVVNVYKIRVANPQNNKGKSSGYRCVVLFDRIHNVGVLVYLYSKSKQTDLMRSQENDAIKLADNYYKEIKDDEEEN